MKLQSIQFSAKHRLALFFETGQQLIERGGKSGNTVLLQLFGNGVEIDAESRQTRQCLISLFQSLFHGRAGNFAVIAKRV